MSLISWWYVNYLLRMWCFFLVLFIFRMSGDFTERYCFFFEVFFILKASLLWVATLFSLHWPNIWGTCTTEETRAALDIIKQQFQYTPRNIRDKESEHGVVWSSVRHALRLLNSDIQIVSTFGLFCLANMSFGGYYPYYYYYYNLLLLLL